MWLIILLPLLTVIALPVQVSVLVSLVKQTDGEENKNESVYCQPDTNVLSDHIQFRKCMSSFCYKDAAAVVAVMGCQQTAPARQCHEEAALWKQYLCQMNSPVFVLNGIQSLLLKVIFKRMLKQCTSQKASPEGKVQSF